MATERSSDLNEERPEDVGPESEKVRGVAPDEDDYEEDGEGSDEEDMDDQEDGTF